MSRASGPRITLIALVIAFTQILITAGCGNGNASTGSSDGGNNGSAPIVTFSADKTTIDPGELVTLAWSTQNATSVTISPNVGEDAPELSGKATVAPTETTTYTITAKGANGTATKSVTITVKTVPPTIQLTATPDAIISGESSSLQWSSTNATEITIDNGVGSVQPPSGKIDVSPTATTT